MNERILVTVEVPEDQLKELNHDYSLGDAGAMVAYHKNVELVKRLVEEVGLVGSGQGVRITFIGSKEMGPESPERTVKVMVPQYNQEKVIDWEVYFLNVNIASGSTYN